MTPLQPRSPAAGGSDTMRVVDKDLILPTSIEHRCEEIIVGGRRAEYYNYVVYAFEAEGVRIQARAYLHDIARASIYPAVKIAARTAEGAITEAPALRSEVIAYLKRRFGEIDELVGGGYEVVWRAEAEAG